MIKAMMETADARVAMRKYRRNVTRCGARGSERKTDINKVFTKGVQSYSLRANILEVSS